VFIASLACCGSVAAASISSSGYMGCRSKDDLDALVRALSQKDNSTFAALVGGGRCVSLKAGQKVTLMGYSVFGATEIMYQGVRLYTVGEAVSTKD